MNLFLPLYKLPIPFKGYHIDGNGVTCQDVDECLLDEFDCPSGLSCENLIGSYQCGISCQPGTVRTENGKSCQDVDECATDAHQCQQVINIGKLILC